MDDEITPNSERNIVEAARRITGKQTQIVMHTSTMWKLGGPLIGAVVMGMAALLWDGLRSKITEGKADASVVDTVKIDVATLQTSVTGLQTDMTEVKREQKESSRILRRVARKLHVEE